MTGRSLLLFRSLFVILLWLLAITLAVALTLAHDPAGELQRQAALWAERKPPHYSYTLTSDRAKASLVVTVDVEDDQVRVVPDPGAGNVPLLGDPRGYSIDRLFAEVRAALDQGAVITYSRYDRHYGYPLSISLDVPGAGHEAWASYNVFDFVELEDSRGR
jgi:hypothetical protein